MSSAPPIPERPYFPFRGVENDETAFQPLDPDLKEIRCVILSPGSGDDPIVCELVYTNINKDSADRTPYVALSYCWGDVEDTVEITLRSPSNNPAATHKNQSSAPFRITRNLFIALQALRNEKRQHLWIDAICINQQDLQEKTHQVQLMAMIYSSADLVMVWLGEHDVDSQCLVRVWTAHLGPLLNSSHPDDDNYWTLRGRLPSDDHSLWTDVTHDQVLSQFTLKHNGTTAEDYSPTRWKENTSNGLSKIFNRPWWSRIWVVQEVLLAPRGEEGDRKVMFRIGNSILHWQDIVELVHLLPYARWASFPVTSGPTQTVLNPWKSLLLADRLNTYKDIQSLLTFTSGFHASDFRDKLFALLQLATDTREAMKYNPLISPDYTKSAKTVFDDLIRWKPELGVRGYARVYRDSLC